jgi:prenyltransferase beta subunit
MRMSRKIWLVLAVAALLAGSFAASVIAAKHAKEDRSKYVTRGLDYLHSRQGEGGGFGTAENTAMAVLGAVSSGERMGNSAWHIKGKNPFDYLQSTDLVAASTGFQVSNAPVYYSRLIMSYVAMDRSSAIGTAGSKGVNLLTVLLSYQSTADGTNKGAFAPALPSLDSAVRTTAWAILALHNAGVSRTDSRYLLAESWLAAQQNDDPGGDGGWSSNEIGGSSDALDTALAYQALTVSSPDNTDWDADLARSFLLSAQRANGGFSSTANGGTDAEATAAGVQAILAMGEHPEDTAWTTASGGTPISALQRLLQTNGSYKSSASSRVRGVIVTGWTLVALNKKPFGSGDEAKVFPKNPGSAHKAFRFRPQLNSISPKNGAKFTKTRVVAIRATYTDFYPKGTGINPKTTRLYVDDINKSRPAVIGNYGLHLTLKNVANGDHTYTIELRDRAGNLKVIERKFKVNVVTPTPRPTLSPTYRPTYRPTAYPTYTPKPYTPTPTPTPTYTPTVTPYPYDSPSPSVSASPLVSGSPIPSPSTSASPAGVGGSGGGGSAAGFVGGTLLAMLPIGAVISYLLLHRREELLGTASQGETLTGGGSTWERFKHTLAKSKDLTRPSSRE